ncbi:MAG: hypothetical protein LBC77_03090 [Spirochaetaceae bacterium]|jgi:hypothetical protein|nr:hypothetical protein [Spirochaetaceae bacterium]
MDAPAVFVYTADMLREITITACDTVYQTINPPLDEKGGGDFPLDLPRNSARPEPAIKSLRGTLHRVDTLDIREETVRSL